MRNFVNRVTAVVAEKQFVDTENRPPEQDLKDIFGQSLVRFVRVSPRCIAGHEDTRNRLSSVALSGHCREITLLEQLVDADKGFTVGFDPGFGGFGIQPEDLGAGIL